MGGACVRVNIQGRKLLSGKLRNTANMGMDVIGQSIHWRCFVNTVPTDCVFHTISSISSPLVTLPPFLSVMTGTRRDQNVRWLEVLE
jgi:hypothetical protein